MTMPAQDPAPETAPEADVTTGTTVDDETGADAAPADGGFEEGEE